MALSFSSCPRISQMPGGNDHDLPKFFFSQRLVKDELFAFFQWSSLLFDRQSALLRLEFASLLERRAKGGTNSPSPPSPAARETQGKQSLYVTNQISDCKAL